MKTKDYTIRLEEEKDRATVENLVREAFWNVYRPGCYEHYLLHAMREHKDFIRELNFVMEKDGEIIGQVVFCKAKIQTDDGGELPVLTMGPICIAPPYKRQGYGKKLLDFALARAAEYGAGAVFLEGNIDFYGKSGFQYASNFGIGYHGLPKNADASFFLGKALREGYLDGIRGEYAAPEVYFVGEKEVEAFDKSFPAKQKQKLPGQLFG